MKLPGTLFEFYFNSKRSRYSNCKTLAFSALLLDAASYRVVVILTRGPSSELKELTSKRFSAVVHLPTRRIRHDSEDGRGDCAPAPPSRYYITNFALRNYMPLATAF
ncbi:hypothetical protein EVAR_43069_1 [Eumeta japonica]|uniref:Uncharacterized protein n=1 Tax=Eumeta variegata TaxID=151549 RepID=A0A4C1WZ36_EUMVA|nr:hypothetical protein EVAR_43069_1 [Eumeta japonica]